MNIVTVVIVSVIGLALMAVGITLLFLAIKKQGRARDVRTLIGTASTGLGAFVSGITNLIQAVTTHNTTLYPVGILLFVLAAMSWSLCVYVWLAMPVRYKKPKPVVKSGN